MEKLTQEEMLEILCAPDPVDAPEGDDFADDDTVGEEFFVRSRIAKEMN